MRETAVWLVTALWLAALTAGMAAWERYDATPGTAGEVVPPAAEPGPWRLTVFLHPRCPCSRATVGELAEVVRRSPGLAARVVFVRPAGVADGWERGDTWDAVAALPGMARGVDDGAEARRLGAETSGQAVLTDPAGRVVFRGGLTRGRGKAGESAGRRAVRDWIETGDGSAVAPVFGCPLFTPDER